MLHRPGLARRAPLRAADRPGRPRPARPRLLPRRRRRQVQGRARELPRLPRRACSSCRGAGRRGGVGARRARPRDGAGARPVDARRHPRPGQGLHPGRARRPRAARAGLRLAGVARRHRPRRQDRRRRSSSQPSYLGDRRRAAARRRRCRPGRRTCARTCSRSYAPFLAKAFVDARFAFVGTTLSRHDREPAALEARASASSRRRPASRSASSTSTRTSRRRRRRAWKSWSPTCSPRIATASTRIDWMSPATKQEAQAKLATFAPKIGYPKRWIDYGALEIAKRRPARQRRRARASSSTRATSPSSASRSIATSGS